MKHTILVMSPEFLRNLLQLPKEATVIDARVDFMNHGILHLKVEGVGWEVVDGCPIQATTAKITNGKFDWGFE